MSRYINKVFKLLVDIKNIGVEVDDVLDKRPGDKKKNKVLETTSTSISTMSLGNLFELYTILRTNLIDHETNTDSINLVLGKFVEVENESDLPTYQEADLRDNFSTSFLFDENSQYTEEQNVTYQDLSWLRKERGWNRKEYGNTDKWELICHDIKDAIVTRLFTNYQEVHGEKKGLPQNIYTKFLAIMNQQNGHWPNFFGTSSSREFKNKFILSETASNETKQDAITFSN